MVQRQACGAKTSELERNRPTFRRRQAPARPRQHAANAVQAKPRPAPVQPLKLFATGQSAQWFIGYGNAWRMSASSSKAGANGTPP